jgi:hypothetical protein
MEENEKFDDFGCELAIASILYNIEKKSELDDTGKFRIDCIEKYIKMANNSLDSILAHNVGKGYVCTPHLIEVVLALANKKEEDISFEDIVKYKEEFSSINSKLENLKTNPKQFYNSKDSEYILNFMKKMKPIFQGKSHPIFGYDPCGYD